MGQNQENPQELESEQALAGDQGSSDSPSSVLPTALAIVGFVAIGWTMLRSAKKRARARRTSESEDPRERISRLRESAQKRSSDTYQAEAAELTRHLSAQLDAKCEALEQLIAQADERLARLDAALGDQRSEAKGSGKVDASPQIASADDGDVTRREVFRLADDGLDPLEIAQKLRQPIGQVRLMLALRRA